LKEQYKEPTSNLSQRAYLISWSLSITNYLTLLTYGILVFLIVLVAFFAYSSDITVQDFKYDIDFIVTSAIITSIGLASIYYFMYRRNNIRLKEWQQDYLEQSYIIVFDTTIPKGNTTSEKVLNLSRAVFPELTREYRSYSFPGNRLAFFIKSKLKPSKLDPAPQTVTYKGKPFSFDLVVPTVDGYFIIKDFKDKVVTSQDLKQLRDVAVSKFKDRSSFRGTEIIRILCVAKEYDQSLMQRETLELLTTKELKADFYMDLIVEEKTGFTVLWVGS
jgi:hypothetical protein